jgi:hypothetical protein
MLAVVLRIFNRPEARWLRGSHLEAIRRGRYVQNTIAAIFPFNVN